MVAGMVLMPLKPHMPVFIHNCPLRRNFLGKTRSGPRVGFRAQAAVGAEKGVSHSVFQATAKGLEPGLGDTEEPDVSGWRGKALQAVGSACRHRLTA